MLALPALRRARKRAEEFALATKTALIQVENGKVVRVHPSAQGEPRLQSCRRFWCGFVAMLDTASW